MGYYTEIEHDKDGFESYDRDRFKEDEGFIVKVIMQALSNKHYPRIGEQIHANEETYYITQIIYYESNIRYYVSDIKQSVFDRMEDLK